MYPGNVVLIWVAEKCQIYTQINFDPNYGDMGIKFRVRP